MYKEKLNINNENLDEFIKILRLRDKKRDEIIYNSLGDRNSLDITIMKENIDRNKLPKIVYNEENNDASVSLKNANIGKLDAEHSNMLNKSCNNSEELINSNLRPRIKSYDEKNNSNLRPRIKNYDEKNNSNIRPRIKNFKEYNRDMAKMLHDSKLILINLEGSTIENVDLTGFDLSNINFEWTTFSNVNLDKAIINNSILDNSAFPDTSLRETSLQNSSMKGCMMRHCDLSNSDISGTNIFSTVLEYTKLTDVKYDENTRFFELYPPASGAYVGFKKCFNQRIATLLIPTDAMRTSATMNCGRCSKAKVLAVKSFDETEEFEYGLATIDEEFEYRVGEYVEVENFNRNRWMDSTTGIHFWMTREEAIAY